MGRRTPRQRIPVEDAARLNAFLCAPVWRDRNTHYPHYTRKEKKRSGPGQEETQGNGAARAAAGMSLGGSD